MLLRMVCLVLACMAWSSPIRAQYASGNCPVPSGPGRSFQVTYYESGPSLEGHHYYMSPPLVSPQVIFACPCHAAVAWSPPTYSSPAWSPPTYAPAPAYRSPLPRAGVQLHREVIRERRR